MRTSFITLALTLLCLASCRRCPELAALSTERITEIKYRDTIIAGATLRDTVHDTILQILPKYRVITKVDSNSRAELRYWKDMYGNLIIQCQALSQKAQLSDTVTSTKTEIVKKENSKFFNLNTLGIVFTAVLLIIMVGIVKHLCTR